MFSPVQLPISPTAMSTVPFDIETSRTEEQEYKDGNNQPGVINLETDGQEHEPKHVKLELRKPKSKIVSPKSTSYNHQKNPAVVAIKKWYQIRGWSLLYPFVVSLYLITSGLEFDLRTVGEIFIASSCVWCFIHLKNFELQKNLIFILLNLLCILVVLGDFLFQFSIIGNKGWAASGSYENCFNSTGAIKDKEFRDEICNVFKAVYYLNSFIYLTSVSSFAVYLLATFRLLKLVNHGSDGNGFSTKLEDEVDLEDLS